jgi:hypothetical protein
MPEGEFSVTLIDRREKASTQRLPGLALTALNLAAQTGLWTSLVADTVAISQGALTRWSIGNVTPTPNPVVPTANNALRKNKLAISYHDIVTGKKYTSQIPISDGISLTFISGTDDLDFVTAGPLATYATDFVAAVRAVGVNSVAIDKIRAIGRHV